MVEYIRSKNLALLIREAFKLIDRRLMDHGSRTAYIFCTMLECAEKYEKYELADLSILATLHDIGAYKTDNLNDMLRFEAKDYLPHSIYGYLFMKYLSPLEEQSKIILYHSSDYSKIENVDYKYIEEASCLHLAEKFAIYHTSLGDTFDPEMFDRYSGTKFSPRAIELLQKALKKYDLMKNLKTEEYQKYMDSLVDYVLFSDEEKNKYLSMLMFCTGFRSEYSVVNTVTTICICKELSRLFGLSSEDDELLYYGALVHDIGMLAIPRSIIDVERKLTPQEHFRMERHVEIEEKIFANRLLDDVTNIAVAHHERGDGSGYPRKLKEHQITFLQGILQAADTITALVNKRIYRDAFDKNQVIQILTDEMEKGRFRQDVITTFIIHYDEIISRTKTGSSEILKMHSKLHEQYEIVYRKLNPIS